MWDLFRPVTSVDERPRCRKSVGYCFSPFLQEPSWVFTGGVGLPLFLNGPRSVCLQPSELWGKKQQVERTGKVSIHPCLSGSLTHSPVLLLCNTVTVLGKGLLETSGVRLPEASEPRGTRLGLGRRLHDFFFLFPHPPPPSLASTPTYPRADWVPDQALS